MHAWDSVRTSCANPAPLIAPPPSPRQGQAQLAHLWELLQQRHAARLGLAEEDQRQELLRFRTTVLQLQRKAAERLAQASLIGAPDAWQGAAAGGLLARLPSGGRLAACESAQSGGWQAGPHSGGHPSPGLPRPASGLSFTAPACGPGPSPLLVPLSGGMMQNLDAAIPAARAYTIGHF